MLWVSAENSGDIASQRFSFWRAATSAARMSLVLASLGALVTMQKSLLSSTNQCLIPVGRSEAVRDLARGFVHNFERRREGFSRGSCGGWWAKVAMARRGAATDRILVVSEGAADHTESWTTFMRGTSAAIALRTSRPALSSLLRGKAAFSGSGVLRVEKAFGRNMNPLVHTPSAFDLAPRARVRNKFV